jgi:hypothetical protein
MKASKSDVRMTAQATVRALSATVLIRTYFSRHHILGAAHFARQSAHLEASHASGTPFDHVVFEHRGYVIGAVLSSTAFLEAAINEVFADAADQRDNEVKKRLPEDTVRLLADMWRLGVPRTSRYKVLEKYQIALTLARHPKLAEGRQPYQDTALLVDLRNALTHAEPETSVHSTPAIGPAAALHKFEKQLRTKFPESALFAPGGNAYFPDKCLGHGCAEWSVTTALAFADDFFKRTGLSRPLEGYRDRLGTR